MLYWQRGASGSHCFVTYWMAISSPSSLTENPHLFRSWASSNVLRKVVSFSSNRGRLVWASYGNVILPWQWLFYNEHITQFWLRKCKENSTWELREKFPFLTSVFLSLYLSKETRRENPPNLCNLSYFPRWILNVWEKEKQASIRRGVTKKGFL